MILTMHIGTLVHGGAVGGTRGDNTTDGDEFRVRCRRYERVCIVKIIQFGLVVIDEINLAGQVQSVYFLFGISLHVFDREVAGTFVLQLIRRFMSILEIL